MTDKERIGPLYDTHPLFEPGHEELSILIEREVRRMNADWLYDEIDKLVLRAHLGEGGDCEKGLGRFKDLSNRKIARRYARLCKEEEEQMSQ